ncbi:MAG TPA: ATP-binding protein [Bryobacteraceae bacterium]|nr:ATP-binding protein [Bryobacteraceae bacterium]
MLIRNRTTPRPFWIAWIALPCLVALLAIGSHLNRRAVFSREYRIGYENNPPNIMKGPDGKPTGLGPEVVAAAARRRGIKLKWVYSDKGSEKTLRAGGVDLWPVFTDIPERRQYLRITDAWLEYEMVLVGRPERIARIKKPGARLEVSEAFRVGAQFIPITKQTLPQWLPGGLPVDYPSPVAALEGACRGEVDAAYMGEPIVVAQILGGGDCRAVPLRMKSIANRLVRLGIGARLEAAVVADELRDEIARMAVDGELVEILNRWAFYSLRHVMVVDQLVKERQRSQKLVLALGALMVVLGVLVWMTVRLRRLRKKAESANEAKSAFVANVTHELRTPISGVIGLSKMLRETPLETSQQELVSHVSDCARTTLAIIDDILDLAKVEAKKLDIVHTRFRLPDVLREVVTIVSPRAEEKGLAIRSQVAANLPEWVFGDSRRLRQVLLNLAGNAVKFTASGQVSVTVNRAAGERLLFSVADTGVGMDARQLERLFRPFEQADATTSRRYGGTGLGLPIARALVEQLGGRLDVETALGKGSRFWFELPMPAAADPLDRADGGRREGEAPMRPLHVLLAEDNAVNSRVARFMLEGMGHQVRQVTNGEETLAAWSEGGFDVVLMDCQMPVKDGFQTTREIRERQRGASRTPIVAMTANAMKGDRDLCLDAGMDDYLCKPVDPETLRAALEKWSERAREGRDL